MSNVVAETILSQLGGGSRLAAMIGAHSFVGDGDALIFKWKARAKNGATCAKVALDASDTYTLTFYAIRKRRGVPEVKTFDGIEFLYADNLRSTFERETGLFLSI